MGTICAAVFQFLSQIFLAKTLGPESYGSFAAAYAVVATIAPLAGFGVYRFLLRAFGEEGWEAIRWVPSAIKFAGISTAAVIFALISSIWFFNFHTLTGKLTMLLAPFVAGQIAFELASSKFQLEERFQVLSLWQVIPSFSRFSLVVAAYYLLGPVFTADFAAYCYIAVALVLVTVGVIQVNGLVNGKIQLVGHSKGESTQCHFAFPMPSTIDVAKQSWAFGADGLFFLIYLQSGLIILERTSGAASTAIYSVALAVVMATYLLPGVIYQKFLLARLHRWAYSDQGKLAKMHKLGQLVMLALGVVSLALIWLLASPIIHYILGDGYKRSVEVLRVLSFCVPLRFLSSSSGAVMSTGRLINKKIMVLGIAATINVVLCVLLSYRYGVLGAAWSAVFAELIVLIGLALLVRSSGLIRGKLEK